MDNSDEGPEYPDLSHLDSLDQPAPDPRAARRDASAPRPTPPQAQPPHAAVPTPAPTPSTPPPAPETRVDVWENDETLKRWKEALQTDLSSKVQARRLADTPEARRQYIEERFKGLNDERIGRGESSLSPVDRELLVDHIINLGIIQRYLDDEKVNEIQILGSKALWLVYGNRTKVPTNDHLTPEQLIRLASALLARCGRESVSPGHPIADGFFPDTGTRVNVTHESVCMEGTTIILRKHGKRRFTLNDLTQLLTVPRNAAEAMTMYVRGRANILISGGTDSGKTTLLNALADLVQEDHRLCVIEDAVELNIDIPNITRMHTRPADIEGKGAVTIRDLVKNSLRMSPHRVIVGEVRSEEALDMLQAMNTGHSGSLTTNHADSAHDGLDRIEVMCFMGTGSNVPSTAIRRQIASGINLIVYIAALPDGSRRVCEIVELNGINPENNEFILTTLWSLDTSVHGAVLAPVERISKKLEERFRVNGVDVARLRAIEQGR